MALLYEPAGTSWTLLRALRQNRAVTLSAGKDPIQLLKAVKDETEIAGQKETHRRDGAAMVRFEMELRRRDVYKRQAVEQGCQIICCSALLTTTMGMMEEVVKKAEEAGIRDKVKIMVGGAPVTEAFCEQIGADKYTADAASAADAAVALCRASA